MESKYIVPYVFLALLVFGATLWILYAIIKSAVKSANRDLLRATQMQNYLLAEGLNVQNIERAKERFIEGNSLTTQLKEGKLTYDQYKIKAGEYFI